MTPREKTPQYVSDVIPERVLFAFAVRRWYIDMRCNHRKPEVGSAVELDGCVRLKKFKPDVWHIRGSDFEIPESTLCEFSRYCWYPRAQASNSRPHTGGDTSRVAAESMSEERLGKLQRESLQRVVDGGTDGALRDDVEGNLGVIHNTSQPRCRELLQRGLVYPRGLRMNTRGFLCQTLVYWKFIRFPIDQYPPLPRTETVLVGDSDELY